MYSLESNDNLIDENFMKQIYEELPKICRSRLICIGIRSKNSLFAKYFKYYLEFDERSFNWSDKEQAKYIIDQYAEKFNLHFNYNEL